MTLLTEIIPIQNFEIVRNQIGAIIKLELEGQASLNTEEAELLSASVFVERTKKIDHTETPLINVLFDNGVPNSQDTNTQDNTYAYNIDFFTGSKTNQDEEGDKLSRFKMNRLMGVVRAILESPHYRTLGLATPSVMNRMITNITAGGPIDNEDSRNVMFGTLTLGVRISETTEQFKPIPLQGSDTTVKLEDTEKGYQYILNST